MAYSAKGSIDIRNFFRASNATEISHLGDEITVELIDIVTPNQEVSELRLPSFNEKISDALDVLTKCTSLSNNKQLMKKLDKTSKFDFIHLTAVRQYFELILKDRNSKMESSAIVAVRIFHGFSIEWKSKCIRKWASYYLDHHELPESMQGRHQKISSLINCEDVRSACLSWIRSTNHNMICGRSFSGWVTAELHKIVGYPEPIQLSVRHATRWLHRIGQQFFELKKGSYIDGHERPDVVEYRVEFLKRMAAYELRMVKYVGDDCEVALRSELEDGERPLVLVVQDESCFASYEGQKTVWMLKDKNILKPKSAG